MLHTTRRCLKQIVSKHGVNTTRKSQIVFTTRRPTLFHTLPSHHYSSSTVVDIDGEVNEKMNVARNDYSEIPAMARAVKKWAAQYAVSPQFSQSVLEDVLLRAIQITSMLPDQDARALTTQSVLDNFIRNIFVHKRSITDLSLFEENIYEAEDIIPVLLQNTEIYEQAIRVYCENGYPEQVFELYENIKLQYVIQERAELLTRKSLESTSVADSSEQDTESNKNDEVPPLQLENGSIPEDLQSMLTSEVHIQLPSFLHSETYSYLLQACAAVGKVKEVIALYHYMNRNNVTFTSQIFETIIRAFIPHGHIAGALHFFEQMTLKGINPTADTCADLMECFLEADDHRYKSVYKGFINSNISLNERLAKKYLSCLCNVSHDIDTAISFIEEHESNHDINIDIESYNLILHACVDAGNIVKGLQIYEKIIGDTSHVLPTTDTLNLILRLFSSQGDRRAMSLFTKMQQEKKDQTSVYRLFEPNTDTYNALIEMHIQNHDLNSAKEVLLSMKAQGIKPNVISHNLLMKEMHTTLWEPKYRTALDKHKGIFHKYLKASSNSDKRERTRYSSSSASPLFGNLSDEHNDELVEDELVDRTVEIAHNEERRINTKREDVVVIIDEEDDDLAFLNDLLKKE
jgi:pentatricopeptide repeat protein